MPTGPQYGSIARISGTLVGAKAFFMCDRGFVPAGEMSANCTSDGVSVAGIWNPDPASLICNGEMTELHSPDSQNTQTTVPPHCTNEDRWTVFLHALINCFIFSPSVSPTTDWDISVTHWLFPCS